MMSPDQLQFSFLPPGFGNGRMSPESQPPYVPPGFGNISDVITVSIGPMYPGISPDYDSNFQYEQPRSLKRPRDDDNQSDNVVIVTQRTPSSSIPINKGNTNIFFKTRVCMNFKTGLCRNGEGCNFAHGIEDLRQPPPNWHELVDDEQKISLKMKLCKKFSNGELCPYGERCNFLHEDPKKYRDDVARFRENSVISIGTTPPNHAAGHGNGLYQAEMEPVNSGSDTYRMNMRSEYWRTKICTKFQATGFCTYGENCYYAHGTAELRALPVGRLEGELRSMGHLPSSVKPFTGAPNDQPASIVNNGMVMEERTGKKDFSKLKGTKKINRIYADWIDDLPLDTPLA